MTVTPEQIPAQKVYLTCRTPELETRDFCGGAYDDHQYGCWSQQYFYFSMQDRLKFTVKFTNTQAEVYLWTESEYNNTGSNTVRGLSLAGRGRFRV